MGNEQFVAILTWFHIIWNFKIIKHAKDASFSKDNKFK